MGAHESNILISVIIPSAWPYQVTHTISSLLRQTLPSPQYEIILVTPDPQLIAEPIRTAVRIIGVSRLYPPGKMRNIGVRHARGEYLCFIDDDCIAPGIWIEKMLMAIKSYQRIGAVGCRVASMKIDSWSRCADFALFADYQYMQPVFSNLGSAALCVRRAAYEDTGGFDESIEASEDWDFSLKLQACGWRCIFDPAVEVFHDHRRDSPAKILKSAYRSGKYSGLRVQRRHYDKMSWLAKMSLLAGDYHFYSVMIFPYALAVTLLQFFRLRSSGFETSFIPFVLLAKIAYHIGVSSSDVD